MRPIEALALGQSARGVTDLVILLGILALNFVAVAKIITKAGYSPRWIWVPLTPVCLWFFTLILLAVDVRTIVLGRDATVSLPVSLGNFALLQVADVLSVIVTWVFFLIFAFSTWPVTLPRREARSFERDPRTTFVPVARSRAGAPALTPDIPGSGAATTTPAHSRPVPVSAQTLPPPSVERSRITTAVGAGVSGRAMRWPFTTAVHWIDRPSTA